MFMILVTGNFQRSEVIMMPISMSGAGETVVIKKITGDEKVRQHLAELGFVVDEEVTVVSEAGGNLILKVKDSRIAIGLSMANRILVLKLASTN